MKYEYEYMNVPSEKSDIGSDEQPSMLQCLSTHYFFMAVRLFACLLSLQILSKINIFLEVFGCVYEKSKTF